MRGRPHPSDALRDVIPGERLAIGVGVDHEHLVGVWLGWAHFYGSGSGRIGLIHAGTFGLTLVRCSHVTGVVRLDVEGLDPEPRRRALAMIRGAADGAHLQTVQAVDRARDLVQKLRRIPQVPDPPGR